MVPFATIWLRHVDQDGILAIAIEFPEASFPDYLWYHFGNLHDEGGTPNPREQWTYGIDERLFAALQEQGLTNCRRYGLFGHSAGGQFVHRMLSFGYRDCVAVAVSAERRYLRHAGFGDTVAIRPRRSRVSGRMHCANWSNSRSP